MRHAHPFTNCFVEDKSSSSLSAFFSVFLDSAGIFPGWGGNGSGSKSGQGIVGAIRWGPRWWLLQRTAGALLGLHCEDSRVGRCKVWEFLETSPQHSRASLRNCLGDISELPQLVANSSHFSLPTNSARSSNFANLLSIPVTCHSRRIARGRPTFSTLCQYLPPITPNE